MLKIMKWESYLSYNISMPALCLLGCQLGWGTSTPT